MNGNAAMKGASFQNGGTVRLQDRLNPLMRGVDETIEMILKRC